MPSFTEACACIGVCSTAVLRLKSIWSGLVTELLMRQLNKTIVIGLFQSNYPKVMFRNAAKVPGCHN